MYFLSTNYEGLKEKLQMNKFPPDFAYHILLNREIDKNYLINIETHYYDSFILDLFDMKIPKDNIMNIMNIKYKLNNENDNVNKSILNNELQVMLDVYR